jgi:carbamoyl-phosphate synthase small subunit
VPGGEKEEGLSRYFESDGIRVRGLVVAELSGEFSHWSARRSLSEWMGEQGVPGINGVDTRALTRRLRARGTMLGKLVIGEEDVELTDPMKENLASGVSVGEPVLYERGERRVVLVDCGVKNNIIRAFLRRDITVLRVPWDHDFTGEEADGIVLSNGPGDPKTCGPTIEHTKKALEGSIPILGICLGSQILGLAAGADTYKLKYGHRGHNQPCVEVGTKNRCYITSQNHGYAVDAETLPVDWREWFYNNNDETNEGIIHISKPFFGAQFHPEASPGPDDTEFIFDMFVRALP